jgi:hypothetical protein
MNKEFTKQHKQRVDLSNRSITLLVVGATIATLLYFIVRAIFWTEVTDLFVTGSPTLYLIGVIGSTLILVPFAFSVMKRTGMTLSPTRWFIAHGICGTAGCILLFVHSGGHFTRPPTILLLFAVFLIIQGAWARIRISREISGTFGSKHQSFFSDLKIDSGRLASLIKKKETLLPKLDPSAVEATFSPTMNHWLRHPILSFTYYRLAAQETRIVNAHTSHSVQQKYWRAIHIGVALLFLAGLPVHVITVTFFAGYVADGGPITWWYITDWDF